MLKGIFFWKKQKPWILDPERRGEIMAMITELAPEVKNLLRRENPIGGHQDITPEGVIVGRMYDFFKNFSETTGSFEGIGGFISGDEGIVPNGGTQLDKEDSRIEATPKSIEHELERSPAPHFEISVEGLQLEEFIKCVQNKIDTLSDKRRLSNQRYAKAQINGLIKRLENRKKYYDHVDFFTLFPNTTDAKIDALVSKYKLVVNPADIFIPTFPPDVVAVMKTYTEKCQQICGENPVFYVIAQEVDFMKKNEKLDPILLVQSPFGFFWQILGAWDEEMLLLSEL